MIWWGMWVGKWGYVSWINLVHDNLREQRIELGLAWMGMRWGCIELGC